MLFDVVLFSVIPQTASLSVSPSDATIETGTSVTMTCATASTTSGSITYIFLETATEVQNGASAIYTLTAATSDTGSYTCTATISGVASVASTAHAMTVVGKSEAKRQ